MYAAVMTYCSRRKLRTPGLLPARERYAGSHIAAAGGVAKRAARPLLIFSSLYGVLEAHDLIPWYDYRLPWGSECAPHCWYEDRASAHVLRVRRALHELHVRDLWWVSELNGTTWPYDRVVETACEAAVSLRFVKIPLEFRPSPAFPHENQ